MRTKKKELARLAKLTEYAPAKRIKYDIQPEGEDMEEMKQECGDEMEAEEVDEEENQENLKYEDAFDDEFGNK